ncbi:MAG: redoxin domain-containing protein [Lutisporaceae bacterium]
MKKSIIIWTIALTLIVVAVYTTYQYNNQPTPAPSEAQTQEPSDTTDPDEETVDSIDAIDFKLNDLTGKEVLLSNYKGKNIYVNFWASWCDPCKYEMPFLEQLYKERKDTDLVILTVNLQESKSVVDKFMADNKYTFPVLLDKDGEAANTYGIQSIPLSILIDKDFKIVSAHEGSMENYEMIRDFVDQLKE